jgi:hypothetical protein
MFIATESPATLEPEDAVYMTQHLCRQASEFSRELVDATSITPMVVVYEEQPVAWVATHQWRGFQTLEGFTHEEWRRRGLCRIASLVLIAGGYLRRDQPIAVFSPECAELTRDLGFAETRLFRRDRYGDWSEAPKER